MSNATDAVAINETESDATANPAAASAAAAPAATQAAGASGALPVHAPVVVIGYGTAGVNAIIGLRNAGYDGPVCVLSNTGIAPYSPILTSYYAGGQKSYDECFPWSADELADLQVQVMENCPAVHLDPDEHTIATPQGTIAYDKCVIATGAVPMCGGFPEVQGGSYQPLVLRTMDDAQRLKDVIEGADRPRMLVSGASMVALKTVEACLNRGLDVTLVGMNDHVLDMNALPPAALRFEAGLRALGVKLRLGQTISQVQVGADGTLQVGFSGGDQEAFDHIAVSHGMKSNLDFVKPGSLETDRALVVDEFMRTSNPDVYAAGDVAQALELVSGEKQVVGIWKNAAVQGACAGAAIAAELAGRTPDPGLAYRGSVSTNTIAVKNMLFISGGTAQVDDSCTVEVREAGDTTVVLITRVASDGQPQLVGFNLVCDNDQAGSKAYDTGAMLTMRIEQTARNRT